MKSHIAALVLLSSLAAPAMAASDPVSGAAERFFTIRPGGSAPASPSAFGGDSCRDASPGDAVWWGRFAGGRNTGLGKSGSGRVVTHTSQGCFPGRGACEAWLIALKTRYNTRPIYDQCRMGYEPGAPVPPWWAPRY